MGFFSNLFSTNNNKSSNESNRNYSETGTSSLNSDLLSLVKMSQEIYKDVASPYEVEATISLFFEYAATSPNPLLKPMAFKQLCKGLAQLTNERIADSYVAREFILQELDGARLGNETAKTFAKNSGFLESEYLNALSNEDPRIDGAGGPQQFLNFFVGPLAINMFGREETVEIRMGTVKEIMRMYHLGNY